MTSVRRQAAKRRRGVTPSAMALLSALASLAAASLLFAPVASAAPSAVDPLEVFRAASVDEVTVGLDEDGSGSMVFEATTGRGGQALHAVKRGDAGGYARPQELSDTHNIDAPTRILFGDSGRGFAAWGVNTNGADAEWAPRPAGGVYGAVRKVSGCNHYLDYDMAPDGSIVIACYREFGSAPNDDYVFYGSMPPTRTTLRANRSISGPGIDDNFIQPLVSVGADGTEAIGWYERDDSSGDNKVEVVVRPSATGSLEPIEDTLVETSERGETDLADLEVLPDGTVLALVRGNPGLDLYTRPPGDSSAWAGPEPLLDGRARGRFDVGAGGRVVLVAEQRKSDAPETVSVATRPPGGSFGAFSALESGDRLGSLDVHVAPNGTALVSWEKEDVDRLLASLAPPGGSFGAPIEVAEGIIRADVALDPAGNALAAWGTAVGSEEEALMAGGIDSGAPPQLGSVRVPATVVAGAEVTLSARAADWSGIREVRWDVPGDDDLLGERVTHEFSETGEAVVRISAVDNAGNETTASREVQVVASGSPPDEPSRDRLDPALFLQRVLPLAGSPRRPAARTAARHGGRRAPRRQTAIGYWLSEPARTVLLFQRARPGLRLRVGGESRCLRPTRRVRRLAARQGVRRCRQWRNLRPRLARPGELGLNRFAFNGRLGRRPLPPGLYRLLARAVDPAGNASQVRGRNFKIVRRR